MAAISSAVRRSVPVRTRAVPPISPAGAASASPAMASAISARVRSCWTRAREGTSTTVSGAAMPWIVVRVTPSRNSRRTSSSAMRPSWPAPTGPVITTSVTRSRQPPRDTSGSSAASGRSLAPSIAASTSAAARAMSQPGSNSISISARPSTDSLSIPATPSTARSAGPRTPTMPSSTASEPAPSQITETSISSETTSGKNCARIRGRAARPRTIISASRRFAAVRWRVK